MKHLLILIPIALLLSGCFSQTRSQTTKADRISFQAQVPIPTAEGVKVVPVTGTIRRVGTEAEESHAGPDPEAITQAVAAGLATIAPAASSAAFPWSTGLGSFGAAFTAAMTGYLALKKREQMKLPATKRET